MKKFTSFLLMLTMLISIIYLPGLTLNISAATMPDGTTMSAGMNESTYAKDSSWIAINSNADFATVANGGKIQNAAGKKYYLTTTITISKSIAIDYAFTFDGCGNTIKTSVPLFANIYDGTIIQNLIIANNGTEVFIVFPQPSKVKA